MDEDIFCPRCRTTKYRNPSLKLMVNVCGHALCESCVEMLFVKGAGKCPECDTNLRRAGFREQLFEDPYIEKETQIRKKILQTFNKKEDDFDTLREYNDYLEMVENIIFNLANDIDVEETRREIEEYKKANKESIERNRYRKSNDEFLIDDLLEKEEQRNVMRKKIHVEEELQISKMKLKSKDDIIDQLMNTELSATEVLKRLREQRQNQLNSAGQAGDAGMSYVRPERQSTFSTGIKIGGQVDYARSRDRAFVPDEPYYYEPLEIETEGPSVPLIEDIERDGYLQHVRQPTPAEIAGGFMAHYPCIRALQEAFNGLYYKPEDVGETHHLENMSYDD